jgi:hypothetical protein
MTDIAELEMRRNQVLCELASIRTLTRGTLAEQFLEVPQKDREPALRGPYFVLVKKVNGRSSSRRVKRDEVDRVRVQVENCRKFDDLCKQLELLTEELGELERGQQAQDAAVKKKPRRRPSRAKK